MKQQSVSLAWMKETDGTAAIPASASIAYKFLSPP